MPYIDKLTRKEFDKKIDELLYLKTNAFFDIGEINYIITRIVHKWIEEEIERCGKRYSILSMGHNVLCDAAAEYYRTVLGKYEDKKRIENGAISSLDEIQLNEVR